MKRVLMNNGKVKVVETAKGHRLESKVGETIHFVELTTTDFNDLKNFFSNLLITDWFSEHYYDTTGQGD